MPFPRTYHVRLRMPQSAEQVYGVVSDILRYPEYIPYCVFTRDVSAQYAALVPPSANIADAREHFFEMAAGFRIVHDRYVSRVCLVRDSAVLATAADSRLFSHLDVRWHFANDGDTGCIVTFEIDFEFRSYLYAYLANLFFVQTTKEMVNAFRQRVAALHGGTMGCILPWASDAESILRENSTAEEKPEDCVYTETAELSAFAHFAPAA